MTRIQTYFLINIQLDKKTKLSYDKFKNEIWPFFWEKIHKNTENTYKGLSVDQFQAILEKPITSSRVINAND